MKCVDCIKLDWRGSNIVKELPKRETKWIFHTDTLAPKGFNVELEINSFISDI